MAEKRGAKGKYEYWISPDGLLLLEAWARDGATLEIIAKKCNVTVSTLCLWKNQHPQIMEALKRNNELVDIEVENALLKNARGYTYYEEVAIKVKEEVQKDGQKVIVERVEIVKVEKTKQGETTAQLAWLNNRKPEQWRQRQIVKFEGQSDTGILTDLTKWLEAKKD